MHEITKSCSQQQQANVEASAQCTKPSHSIDSKSSPPTILIMANHSDFLLELTDELVKYGQEMCSEQAHTRQPGYKSAARALMSLKSLNRAVATGLDAKRREIEAHKERVDNLRLKLENLLYKRAYLLREIRECRDFSTPALDAVESETQHTLAQTQFSRDLPRKNQESIEFLEQELSRREAAQKQLEQRKAEYLVREEVLDGRRKIVDELPVRITNVESAVLKELTPIFAKGDAITSTGMQMSGNSGGGASE